MMYRATITEGPEQLIGRTVLCTVNGNMRRFNIRVLPGDAITGEMSIYDLQRVRITRRLRENAPEATIETPVEAPVAQQATEEAPTEPVVAPTNEET